MPKRKKSICRKIGESIYSIGKLTTGELTLFKISKKDSRKICKRIVK